MTLTIDELTVADAAAAWSALGFEVEDGVCVLGEVRVRLVGGESGGGLTGWSLRGLADDALAGGDLDGLPTTFSERPPPDAAPGHANGIAAIDHVVAFSPDLDRTVEVLRGAGLDLRRVREQPTPAGAPRQAFFRLGAEILEVVQQPPEEGAPANAAERPAFFWGLALLAPDLDSTVAMLGERVSDVRDAVQPGRQIATLRRGAGLAVPVALISP